MPVFTTKRPAPIGPNTLAAYEAGVGADPQPSWFERNKDLLNPLTSLVQTGIQVGQQRDAAKDAQRRADAAAHQSMLQQMLAMESIKGTQKEQELLAALRASQAASPSGGMPGWVLPAALGGGALLLILFVAMQRKNQSQRSPHAA